MLLLYYCTMNLACNHISGVDRAGRVRCQAARGRGPNQQQQGLTLRTRARQMLACCGLSWPFGMLAAGAWCLIASAGAPALSVAPSPADLLDRPVRNHSLIHAINSDGLSWRAGVNDRFRDATLRDVATLCRTVPEDGPSAAPSHFQTTERRIAALPQSFDWRHQPIAEKCPSIARVRDQAGCGSCWAFSTAEAMSDRLCIGSAGNVSVELSVQDIASCACSPSPCGGGGCGGGQLGQAWDYFLSDGVVDGGPFGDTRSCDPYTLPSCAHHTRDPRLKNCTESVSRECPSASAALPRSTEVETVTAAAGALHAWFPSS